MEVRGEVLVLTGTDAALPTTGVDLLLLDLPIPDVSGFYVLKRWPRRFARLVADSSDQGEEA
jgi:hypothetical protein